MTLEFDPRCATSQPEDTLQVSLPIAAASTDSSSSSSSSADSSSEDDTQRPVFRKFFGKVGWPVNALLVPGNAVNFTLETASDYVKEDQGKAAISEFGFRCVVTGYDAQALSAQPLPPSQRLPQQQQQKSQHRRGGYSTLQSAGLLTLEREVAFLAATCASSLLKTSLI